MEYYNLHFEASEDDIIISDVPDIGHWKLVLSLFLEQSDNFRVDCWVDEGESIKSISLFAKSSDYYCHGNLKKFYGDVTPDFVEFILNKSLDKNGRLKWFSVFIYNGDYLIFSSEHYGTECIAFSVNTETLNCLRQLVPGNFSWYQWKCQNNEYPKKK